MIYLERTVKSINYDNIKRPEIIRTLCEEYPFLRKDIIGKSCAGKDIYSLTLGRAREYSLFAAAFHGSEHITENILLFFIEELCCAVKNNGSLAGINARKGLYGRGVIFVPCVNPDGCEISVHGASGCANMRGWISRLCKNDFLHWNANLRGVDINHNFDAGWKRLHELEKASGIYGPAPTRYGGTCPESEPETKALTELCRTKRISRVIALHSQGEVIYWTYGDKKPPHSEKMAEIMATSSGYALDVPVGIAEGGGFKDWFISEFNRPGFTVEAGRGENPLPIESAFAVYKDIRELLMLCSVM